MRLLILGGNRFIGEELVKQAVKQGHDVTVLSLDKPSSDSAKWLKANRNASLSRTFSKLAFDSVIDNIAFRAQHVSSLIEALRGRVCRYVLTSSVDIYCNQAAKYCDELEDERLEPCLHSDAIPKWEAYLRGKRACEIALRSSPHFEKVVVRPAVVIGARDNIMCSPEGSTSRSLFFPLRIADGGPVLLRHTDIRLHQMAYVGDVAKALLLAATHPLAAGQVLNVVGDEVWTNERLVYGLSRSVGHRTDVLRVSNAQLEAAGLVQYQTPYYRSFMNAWSLFSNKRLTRLGWSPTPVEEWGPTLFCFPDAPVKGIAEQRQQELRLAQKILNHTPVSIIFRLKGKFCQSEQAISSVGIGTHRGSETPDDDRAYFAAIKHAVRGGINVIDTAINYRCMRSEQVVGKAIQSLAVEGTDRSSLCVVTKGGFIPPSLLAFGVLSDAEVKRKHSITAQYIAVSLQQSLRNTELETIDAYLLHNPEVSLELLGEANFYDNLIKTFAMLEQRVRDGVIGTYGIATWDGLRTPVAHKRHIDLKRVINCSELAAGGSSNFKVIELPFNYRAREAATVLSQELDNRLVSTLDLAAARGLLVLTSASVMSGAGDSGKSLQFVRSYSQVSCALVGMRRLEHVDQAIAIMGLVRNVAPRGGARKSRTAAALDRITLRRPQPRKKPAQG